MTVVDSAQTTAPTSAPTDAPTSAPTDAPTSAPADGWPADDKPITRSKYKSKYAHNADKITGIVVGSVAFVAIAVGVGVWYNNNRKQQSVELQSGYGRFVF